MVESIISVAARKSLQRTIFENKLLAASYWLLAKPEASGGSPESPESERQNLTTDSH
jgi:hypothetical protein